MVVSFTPANRTELGNKDHFEILKKYLNKPLQNHQKYCIKFKKLSNSEIVCDVSTVELTKTDVAIRFEANFRFNGMLRPHSMTYHPKENVLVFASPGLSGGNPNALFELLQKVYEQTPGVASQAIRMIQQNGSLVNSVGSHGQTPLNFCCKQNNNTTVPISVIIALIKQGANVDAKDASDHSPLFCACVCELVEHVKILLYHKANPNLKCNGCSPLEIALLSGNIGIVKILLLYSAKWSEVRPAPQGYTPEIQALMTEIGIALPNIIPASNLPVPSGSNLDPPETYFDLLTKVYLQIPGAVEKVEKAMRRDGSWVTVVNEQGQTLLNYACRVVDNKAIPINVVQMLIQYGGSVNSPDKLGRTPLYSACACNLMEHVRLLLVNNADPNIKCSEGSPLEIALLNGHRQIASALILYNAKLDEIDYCFDRYTVEIQNLLALKGISKNTIPSVPSPIARLALTKDEEDIALFDKTVRNAAFNELERLIDEKEPYLKLAAWVAQYPTDINTVGVPNVHRTSYHKDWKNNLARPLQIAAKGGSPEFVTLLIEQGAKLDSYPGSESPLYIACDKKKLENVKVLIGKGADVNTTLKENENSTVLVKAVERGDAEIVKELLQAGAKIERSSGLLDKVLQGTQIPSRQRLPLGTLSVLQLALLKGNLDIIQLLLEYGADTSWIGKREKAIDEEDLDRMDNLDPLQYKKLEAVEFALGKCNINIVHCLIEKGAKYLNCDYPEFMKLCPEYQNLLFTKRALSPHVIEQIEQTRADEIRHAHPQPNDVVIIEDAFARGDGTTIVLIAHTYFTNGVVNTNPALIRNALLLYQQLEVRLGLSQTPYIDKCFTYLQPH